MLENIPSPLREKRIGIITRSLALGAMLRGLVQAWQYLPCDSPETAGLLLVEEGCCPPDGHGNVLWLSRSPTAEDNRFGLPLHLPELWRQLGRLGRNSYRERIRLSVRLAGTLRTRGEYLPVRVSSLSEMGVRFEFPKELVRGEKLTLHLVLEEKGMTFDGQVIYVVPRGEVEGTARSEVGMIFDRTPQAKRKRLQEFILWRSLESIREQIPEPLFHEGLDFFQLPSAVLKRLAKRNACP